MNNVNNKANRANNKTPNNTNKKNTNRNRKQNNKTDVINVSADINANVSIDKKGIMNIDGVYINPLTGKPFSEARQKLWKEGITRTGEKMDKKIVDMEVYKQGKNVIDFIDKHQVTLLTAVTGGGKSIWLGPLLVHYLDYKGKIIMTIPKVGYVERSYSFLSDIMNSTEEKHEVGLRHGRMSMAEKEKHSSRDTKLLVVTDGYLMAKLTLSKNPYLRGVADAIIMDEVHELNLNVVIILSLIKNIIKVRPEFKVVLMSATTNFEIFKKFYEKESDINFGIIQVGEEKTNFEIKEYWLKSPVNEKEFVDKAISTTADILETTNKGHILVFLTTKNETRDACIKLYQMFGRTGTGAKKNGVNGKNGSNGKVKQSKTDFVCLEYHGGVSSEMRKMVTDNLEDPSVRKVIFSTSSAEASLTITDLIYVIDSGLDIDKYYDPEKFAEVTETTYVSKAQIKQRKGRVGRTQPGEVYYLYTKKQFEKFKDFPLSQMEKEDFTGPLLQLTNMKMFDDVKAAIAFAQEFITPPKTKYIKNAYKKVIDLGLIDKKSGELTLLGKITMCFSRYDPMVARMLFASYYYECVYECIVIACMLNQANRMTDWFQKPRKTGKKEEDQKNELKFQNTIKKFYHRYGDHLTLLNIYGKYREVHGNMDDKKKWCDEHYINFKNISGIQKAADGLIRDYSDIKLPPLFVSPQHAENDKILSSDVVNKNRDYCRMEEKLKINGESNVNEKLRVQIKESSFSSVPDLNTQKINGNGGNGNAPQRGGKSTNKPSGKKLAKFVGISNKDDAIMASVFYGFFMHRGKFMGGKYYSPIAKMAAPITGSSLAEGRSFDKFPRYIIYNELSILQGRPKFNLVSELKEDLVRKLGFELDIELPTQKRNAVRSKMSHNFNRERGRNKERSQEKRTNRKGSHHHKGNRKSSKKIKGSHKKRRR